MVRRLSAGGRRIRTCGPTLRRAALSRRATGIASRSAGESGSTSEGDQKLEIGFVPAARRPRTLRAVRGFKAGPMFGDFYEASSRVLTGPFCDFCPTIEDQELGIASRHLERAIRAHVEVPA